VLHISNLPIVLLFGTLLMTARSAALLLLFLFTNCITIWNFSRLTVSFNSCDTQLNCSANMSIVKFAR